MAILGNSACLNGWLLYLCVSVALGAVTLPGNHDVFITGPMLGQGSFSLSCNCMDFMKSVFQMNPNFTGQFTAKFFSNGTELQSTDFQPQNGLVCSPQMIFGKGGPQDQAINTNISCEMSTKVNLPNQTPELVTSTSTGFYLGFTVESNPLVVKEGEQAMIKIISTVPIMCELSTDCCVTVNLKIPSNKNNIAAISTCNYDICTKYWSASNHRAELLIPLVANKDPADTSDKDMTVQFDPLTPVGGGQVHQLLTNVKIPAIDVKIQNEQYHICTITGDPHIRVFEDNHWRIHIYHIGEFIYYINKQHDVQIHGKNWPCNSRASCLCSMIIRQGNDVIRISICDDVPVPRYIRRRGYNQMMDYVLRHSRMRLKVPRGGLPEGTRVYKDAEKKYIQVSFKSGLKVEVKHPHAIALSARITVPPEHAQGLTGRGLCGTPGKNFTKMLTKGDGSIAICRPTHRGTDCHNNEYNESWRLRKGDSLYWQPPQDNKLNTRNQSLCGCAAPVTGTPSSIQCDFSGNQQVKIKDCQHCTDVTNNLPPGLFGGSFTANKRAISASVSVNSASASVSVNSASASASASVNSTTSTNDTYIFDFVEEEFMAENPTFTIIPEPGPNAAANPVIDLAKEERVREMCTKAVGRSVMMGICGQDYAMLNSSIDECMDDYMITNDDDIMEAAFESFNMLCKFKVIKDPTNYVMGLDGVMEIKDSVTVDMCSQTCSKHGVCQNGTCVCNSGWIGNHCTIKDTAINTTAVAANMTTTAPNSTTATDKSTTTATAMSTTAPRQLSSQMCDVAYKICSSLNIPAPIGVAPGDATYCRFELTSPRTEILTNGLVNKAGECECPLPKLYVGRNIGAAYVQTSAACEAFGTVGVAQDYLLYDSRCVDSKLTQNASVCIVDSLCYEDGITHPANDYLACNAAQNMTEWTAVKPTILKASEIDLTLSGPDPNLLMMTCALPSAATTDLTVDWLLNGAKVISQNLAAGEDHVDKTLFDFMGLTGGNPGRLICRIEDLSVSPPRVMVSKEMSLV